MRVGRFATPFGYSMIGALVLMGGSPSRALAQDDHSHMQATQSQPQTADQKSKAGALVKAVREATERFQNVAAAEAEGYALQFGCVSGGDFGAMGTHFVNGALVGSGVIDVAHPQIVLYEPVANGRFRLTGADYLVVADTWNTAHPDGRRAHGSALSLVRPPIASGSGVLHAARRAWKTIRRHVQQLEPQRVVRRVQRTNP